MAAAGLCITGTELALAGVVFGCFLRLITRTIFLTLCAPGNWVAFAVVVDGRTFKVTFLLMLLPLMLIVLLASLFNFNLLIVRIFFGGGRPFAAPAG